MIPINELFSRYLAEESVINLADSLGVSRASIYERLSGYEPYKRYQKKKEELKSNRYNLVLEYEAQGLKRTEIADKLGVSVRTVLYIIKKGK